MARLIVGESAPLFELPDLTGQRISLSGLLGRTVLLTFWSAECDWCERADPFLTEWKDRLCLLAVASNANEPPEQLSRVAQVRGMPTVLLDADQQVADRYGAEVTPHLFLIDWAGYLRYQGALDDVTFRRREPTQNYLQQALDALLNGGSSPAVTETPAYGCAIVRGFAKQPGAA